MNAYRGLCVIATHKLLVHLLGRERNHGRKQLRHRHKALPESLISSLLITIIFALPEATARPAQVPARQRINEAHNVAHQQVHAVAGIVAVRAFDKPLQAAEYPPVKLRSILIRDSRPQRIELVYARVGEKELIYIPQDEKFAARIMYLLPAE